MTREGKRYNVYKVLNAHCETLYVFADTLSDAISISDKWTIHEITHYKSLFVYNYSYYIHKPANLYRYTDYDGKSLMIYTNDIKQVLIDENLDNTLKIEILYTHNEIRI